MKKTKTIRVCALAMLCTLSLGAFSHVSGGTAIADGTADVNVNSLFTFADGQASTGKISAATDIPDYLTDGSLKHSDGAISYDDFTNQGAYITLGRSEDVSGKAVTGISNNVVRTATFDITDNTVDDVLFSYIPAPTVSRWLDASEGDTVQADSLDLEPNGTSEKASTAKHFFVKIVDAHNPDNWLRMNYIYRRWRDARYNYGALSLSVPSGTSEQRINMQNGGEPGENLQGVQQDVLELKGAIATQDNVWLKFKDLNSVYYDHAEKALYGEYKNGSKVEKRVIRYLDYAGYGDGYTFDFSDVYLEFYYQAYENPYFDINTNSYIISHLDGMHLGTDDQGTLKSEEVDKQRYKYGVTKLNEEINGKGEYSLPCIEQYNLFGEKDAAAAAKNEQYTVKMYNRRGQDVTSQISGLNDGKWTAAAKMRFDEMGVYKLVYADGDTVVRTLNLKVAQGKIYSDEMFTAENIELTKQQLAPAYMREGVDALSECNDPGLGLRWTQAGTLTINREFSADVFKLGQSIVEFRVTPKKQTKDTTTAGTKSTEYEFENIVVSLVDAENPSVYINFISHATIHGPYRSFTSVAASNQQYANDKKAVSKPADTFGTYAATNGVGIDSTFVGLPKVSTNSYLTTKFYYDNATKQTAVGPAIIQNVNEIPGIAKSAYMFRDLDSPAHLVGDDKPFNGFPSGRVKIKISVSEALWDDANLVLYSVMGNRVGGDYINDELAPEILDAEDFLTVNPQAELNREFPLPKVKSQDIMDGDLTRSVWAQLTTPNAEIINWNSDSFIPRMVGRYYYTVYSADSAGNTNLKVFPIDVYNRLSAVSLQFSDISGAAWEYPDEASIGDKFAIPKVEAFGASGNKSVACIITAPNGEEVDVSSMVVELMQQGVYVVRYEAKDYRGEISSFEYYITVKRDKKPVIEEAMMPSAFLAGKTYTLPEGIAYDYYSYYGEARAVATEIEVSENGGEFVALGADRAYTFADTAGSVSIRYTAKSLSDGTEKATRLYENLPVIKPQAQGEYFVRSPRMQLTYEEIQEGYNEAVFSTNYVGESIAFVNALPSQRLSMRFKALSGTELNALDIYLTDSLDPTQTVILNVRMQKGKAHFSVNGGASSIVTGSLSAGNEFYFSVKTNHIIYDVDNLQIGSITKTANGAPFQGFTSNKVYLKVVVKELGVSGARFAVRNFANQTMFTDATSDWMAPLVITEKEIPRLHDFGDVVTLSKATALDVMDPNAKIVLTVKDPTGAVVSGFSRVSCDVERTLVLEKYGTYTLLYNAYDSVGNSTTTQYVLKVRDNVAPTLEIEGSVKSEYKVGETFALNNVRGVDNLTETDKMSVYVSIKELYTNKITTYECSTYGSEDKEGNKLEFTFNMPGAYSVRYYVRDGAWNVTDKTFAVTVTQ